MKRTSLLATALLALGLVFTVTGCSTFSPRSATRKQPGTFALIASVSGGTAPTDAQWATMQKNFSALLASRGLTLVTDPTEAEKLIQVLFVPDLADPTTGISYVVGVRNNPGSILSPSPTASMASYSYTNLPGFNNFGQPQYYGYYNDYSGYNNYGSGTYTVTPPSGSPVTPPAHHDGGHHVSRPVDCPPETASRPSPGYAGNHPGSNSGGGNHSWSPRPSYESSSSYSSPSYSSSSSYSSPSYSSSSDYVGPTTSYSSSSSSSSPSISFPSSSSSSSASSDSGPRSFGTAPQERPE